LVTVIDAITTDPADAATQRQNDTMLRRVSPTYQMWMRALLDAANVLPPAGAMAGVYAYTDATLGVFRAPANTAVASVMSPTVPITDHDQNNMNTPLNGKAVNAIRSFKDRGVLVWGARTLDGNSQDYRYISVRRTLIMLEQSMQAAIQGFVYSPNNVGTWTMLKNLLDSFLKDQWNAGALSGAVAEEAYSVSVGLGSTMTPDDIPERDMRIDVQVALSSPAEFFTITFQQKMQVA
jgi:phage tail sheath protein FI